MSGGNYTASFAEPTFRVFRAENGQAYVAGVAIGMPDADTKATAVEILHRAAGHIKDRASQRDQPQGERSMARTVAAFNALTGHQLSERDGWMFMVALKAARACSTPTGLPDDYEDLSAYGALAGECAQEVPRG